MLIIVLHTSSVLVTVRATRKKKAKINSDREIIMTILSEFGSLLRGPSCFGPELEVEKRNPIGNHFGHGKLLKATLFKFSSLNTLPVPCSVRSVFFSTFEAFTEICCPVQFAGLASLAEICLCMETAPTIIAFRTVLPPWFDPSCPFSSTVLHSSLQLWFIRQTPIVPKNSCVCRSDYIGSSMLR